MDDSISRQAAIEAIEKVAELFPWRVPGNRDSYDRYNEAWNDAIGRAEIEIEKLPSAKHEQKPGRWNFIGDNMFECTNCKVVYTTNQLNSLRNYDTDPYAPRFCPNCGAKMIEPQESEKTE